MSDEWIAGLITIVFTVTLVAWVPFLIGVHHCVRRLKRASDQQAARSPWQETFSMGAEIRKI